MIRFETINEAGEKLASIIEKESLRFDGEAVVFIGALGICVRKILPMVNDKYTDPAVICIDSTGRYVIPVLSGHVGGANELSRQIAKVIGAEAVVTTQSDNTGLWALDTLAKRFGWRMPALPRISTGLCTGKGTYSVLTPTVGTQPSGRGMVVEPCGFIGWEKNTIYLP